jgi:hypothetical protein
MGRRLFVFAPALWLAWLSAVGAQETLAPNVADNKAGFIDNAIPGNVFRLRFDSAYDMMRPDRAELFFAQSGHGSRGLPLAEQSVSFQEPSAYGEHLLLPGFSIFVQKPLRFVNPDINRNMGGLSDLDAGWKYAFYQDAQTTASFQFRTYIPTGNPHLGLGTGHASVEPALLLYRALGERLALSGELRYWAPVGGTDFAGDILRYGLGLQVAAYQEEKFSVTPVAEVVGWSVLSGQESVVSPTGQTSTHGAAGDTIVNGNIGCRFGLGKSCDLYTGYGHAVTGDAWYRDILRVELRVFY